MKHRIFSALIPICLLVASCEKAIDFKGEEQSPMVVVFSEPEADSVPVVRLTYSRFFLAGGQFRTIGNADVKLSVSGTQYSGLFGIDTYSFPCSVAEGDSLSLSVRMQNGGSDTLVTASTRVPFRPSVTVRPNVGRTFHFSINDRPGEENYYRMCVKVVDTVIEFYNSDGDYVLPDDPSAVSSDTVVDEYWLLFGCSDAALTDNASSTINLDSDEAFDELLFSDELFDGQSRDITIKTSDYSNYYYEKHRHKSRSSKDLVSQTYLLHLESLSKEAYLYELSRLKQDSGDIFMTEPVQIQSNINNGIGVFGAKATKELPIGTVQSTPTTN